MLLGKEPLLFAGIHNFPDAQADEGNTSLSRRLPGMEQRQSEAKMRSCKRSDGITDKIGQLRAPPGQEDLGEFDAEAEDKPCGNNRGNHAPSSHAVHL